MSSVSAASDRVLVQGRGTSRIVTLAVALGAAGMVALLLPAATFRAQAIVAVTDPTSPLSLFLPKAAAEVAVSKPVMRRAAESLIGTGFAAPEPDLAEKIAVAAHLGGTQATGKASRLAADISRTTTAQPNTFPGSVEIAVTADDADRSAQIATAVAEALVAEQEDATVKARRAKDVEAASRIEHLKAESAAARRRLAELGGAEADPAQMRTTAAAQTAAARARVDTIHAILASGSPPLSDRRDMPSAIDALQTSYLDLSRQLAKARETFGDRHTTIISLQAEVKHAAASLAAEWRRLSKLAEGELAAARGREAALGKAEAPADASRHAAIDDARRAVRAADEAVGRAQGQAVDVSTEERGYRLLARAVVPNTPVGLTSLARIFIVMFVVALVFGLARLRQTMALRWSLGDEAAVQTDAPLRAAPVAAETPAPEERPDRSQRPSAALEPDVANEDLAQAMSDLLPELESISPAFGPVPTIIVAANEAGVTTARVALALGRAVAESGGRALLVEAARPESELAAAASDKDDPILVDLFGALSVALRSETKCGLLYLAPSLKKGPRIAAALARGTETPIVDDLSAEFDIVIIDGGEAEACAAAGWGADVYLRVGRFDSRREDALLASTFDVPRDMVIGAVVASTVRRATQKPAAPAARPGASSTRQASKPAPHAAAHPTRPVVGAPAPRRKIAQR